MRLGVEGGHAREGREVETEQDKNNSGDNRPVATLEPSGAGGLTVASSMRPLTPATSTTAVAEQTYSSKLALRLSSAARH